MAWLILALKRYAEFGGRSQRKEYWMFILFQAIVYSAFLAVFVAIGLNVEAAGSGGVSAVDVGALLLFLSVVLFWLGMIVPSLAVTLRRLHDSDRSGWWVLVYVGPYLVWLASRGALIGQGAASQALLNAGIIVLVANFIGGLLLLVFMCLPGTRGANRFGADPKQPRSELIEVFG